MKAPIIHVLDDDHAVRQSLAILIRATCDYEVAQHASVADFQGLFDPNRCGCLLLDYRMPGMTGIELQRWLKSNDISIPVILLTGQASVEMAVQAMKLGAMDVLEKPCPPADLIARLNDAIAQDRSQRGQENSA